MLLIYTPLLNLFFIVVAGLSVFAIFVIIATVLAAFVGLGWSLGAIEVSMHSCYKAAEAGTDLVYLHQALGISILIGAAVDYCLHMGHSLNHHLAAGACDSMLNIL